MFTTQAIGDVAVFSFDRPEKKNALTPGMIRSLISALSTAAAARAIVVTGAGDTFCAGFDLSACRDDPTSAVLAELLTLLARAAAAIRASHCPVVISAHGAALAGGCALAAAGDFVITNAQARIGYPVVRLGISPAVSAPALVTTIGAGAARARLLDSGLVTGARALELGLAYECTDTAGACQERALTLAAELAAKPPHAMGYTKHWLNQLDGSLEEAGYNAALAASLARVGTGEERELLKAIWRT